MNKTHQLFLLFLGLLLSAGCLTGCIKDDLSDCPINEDPEPDPEPTTGTLRLALTYTMHNTQENGRYIDLFNEQVRKVDVFVFDEAGQFLQQITEEAAPQFAENYTKEIELPAGDYQFVVWGNHYEDETVHNCAEEGHLLEDGRMTLLQTSQGSNQIEMLTDSLFHGYTPEKVTVVEGTDQVVPIDLMKNRNDVRVVVRWREKGMAEGFCLRPEHAKNITATLIDNNATHDFQNNVVEKQEVTYLPGRFAEWYNPLFHGEMDVYPTEQEYTYVADFSQLRLMKDNQEARLVIRQDDKVVYDHSLMDLITRLEQYQTQEALDREDRYLIELLFECEHADEPDDPDEPDNPDNPDEPEDPDEPADPDDPSNPDGPDNPGQPDDPDKPSPGGSDDPDDPGQPDNPGSDKPWSAITIVINGWTLIDKDIEL